MDVSDHLHTVYPGRRCARYLTGATDQPALHVFTLVQMSSSASSPPSPAPPATLQDCRQAERQLGKQAAQQAAAAQERCTPLCNAAASAALSCTLAAPPLCTAKQQPDSAALHRHCFAVCSRAMHTVSPNALCHAQQSSKAGFHSAAAALCPASQLHRRRTHWCMTLR